MDVGIELESKARKIVNNCPDNEKIRTACLVSIVGNVLDFGILGGVIKPDELINDFDEIYADGLAHDDTDELIPYLKEGAKILFFTDNCGEIVFDKILCEELKKFKVKIVLIVKGEPILSDATLNEAEEIGMQEIVDEIITTGTYAVGLAIKKIPNDLKRHFNDFDIIISKGMGNFEALSEMDYRPILYLLRTKCNPVAQTLGLPKNLNVAKLFK